MSEFKVGDNVYWFRGGFDGMSDNLPLEDLHIEHTTICCESEIFQRDWGYKSRREALEALAKRLNELLKEE